MCVSSFCTTFVQTLSVLRRTERDMMKNVYWSLCKVPVIVVRLQLNLKFLDKWSKYFQITNFMKIPPAMAEFFHADGQTGRTWRSWRSLFAILRTAPKEAKSLSISFKHVRGSRSKTPLIFNHGNRWRKFVNFTPQPLYSPVKNVGAHLRGIGVGPRAHVLRSALSVYLCVLCGSENKQRLTGWFV